MHLKLFIPVDAKEHVMECKKNGNHHDITVYRKDGLTKECFTMETGNGYICTYEKDFYDDTTNVNSICNVEYVEHCLVDKKYLSDKFPETIHFHIPVPKRINELCGKCSHKDNCLDNSCECPHDDTCAFHSIALVED